MGRSVMLRRRYKVFITEQFERLWRQAIDAGAVDAAVGASQLDGLIAFLSADPYCYPLLEATGETIDLRWLVFMHGTTTRVEIWYSIVEDDRSVYLVSVEIYYPPQLGMPGFE